MDTATTPHQTSRELRSARHRNEQVFGWPMSVDIEHDCLVVPVGTVLDAVTIPSGPSVAAVNDPNTPMPWVVGGVEGAP